MAAFGVGFARLFFGGPGAEPPAKFSKCVFRAFLRPVGRFECRFWFPFAGIFLWVKFQPDPMWQKCRCNPWHRSGASGGWANLRAEIISLGSHCAAKRRPESNSGGLKPFKPRWSSRNTQQERRSPLHATLPMHASHQDSTALRAGRTKEDREGGAACEPTLQRL